MDDKTADPELNPFPEIKTFNLLAVVQLEQVTLKLPVLLLHEPSSDFEQETIR
ncbi:MAG: hypothetical protein H6567_02620 [Lewinellaceae bacterium]|nr:hypothetical protein [Lewinellaceae bacterium]